MINSAEHKPQWFLRLFTLIWNSRRTAVSILLFFAGWNYASQIYGELILPSPQASFFSLKHLLHQDQVIEAIGITSSRALIGFAIAAIAGSLLGMFAGFSATFSALVRPIVTIFTGVPSIAWIILSLFWFGSDGGTPVFTIAITALPITFISGVQSIRTLDKSLIEMGRSFNASRWTMFTDIYLPHMFSYLFPSWVSVLGMSWKVVVMAELFSSQQGIGAGLAAARVNIDTPETMAWIIIMVTILLIVEYVILEPLKRHIERWREA